MCGIVGYIGENNKSIPIIIDGLKKLEYRGYDSSGIAYFDKNKINVIKSQGRILNLEKKLDLNINTNIIIGHTRWATHGIPNEINSHPHQVGKITIVHNGIIENYEELKKEIDCKFKTDTDTEVAAAVLNKLYLETSDILKTISIFQKKVKGAYAIGIICEDIPNKLYAIKKNSPLIIGISSNFNLIASDVPAILKYTNKYVSLEDGDYAEITKNEIKYYNLKNKQIIKDILCFEDNDKGIDKGEYEHFMLKEMCEQPSVIKKLSDKYIKNNKICFDKFIKNINNINRICILGCGSAIHAGYIGKYLIEKYANIPVDIEIASEFRYKKTFIDKNTLIIPISQSGETADTLEALKISKNQGAKTLGIINVFGSSIARICDDVLYTEAGIEIAVATTKAYTAQVFILTLLSIYLSNKKNIIKDSEMKNIIKDIYKLPNEIENILDQNDELKKIAKKTYEKDNIFFIGRSNDYYSCLEGSLKLKEISYIHSEAYPAGELKHGPISLIDKETYVLALVTNDKIASKTISNIKEIKSRQGKIILLLKKDTEVTKETYDYLFNIDNINNILQPIINIIPFQLISYHIANFKNCEIDKPKNLAKSVTVE